ncbi:hypothetical protein BJ978_002648 [Agromyces terreus]|uniref:DUF3099 domain-containing protein n=1 Tax=Agromyces terreus TaxID=424795 RepID=A0A9X2H744_9MICO|nr:DUF3099 domain-containing protein [Agromyces terreus]MCP2371972.1 hypothetical protein [Agromyces terreus]
MKQQSITSLPPSPEAEQRSRMIKYSVAMGVRIVCIIAMLFARDWWLVVCAVGAIALPYFAVVIANVGSPVRRGTVEGPGAIVPLRSRSDAAGEPAPGASAPADGAGSSSQTGPAASDTDDAPDAPGRDEDAR